VLILSVILGLLTGESIKYLREKAGRIGVHYGLHDVAFCLTTSLLYLPPYPPTHPEADGLEGNVVFIICRLTLQISEEESLTEGS